jgi:LCP family protein required for cell wall assembly
MIGFSGLSGGFRRTTRQTLAWTGGLTALAVLAVSGYGWAVTDAMDAATVRADVFAGLGGRPADSPATDILIVGSDTRVGLQPAELDRFHAGSQAAADGARSDTMILAQLAADGRSLTLLSIPRDSYVDIPAWGDRPDHHDKINSALDIGGPGLAVATVEQATGIRVDHYLQVDFSSFAEIVDALGGVDVCLAKAADDPLSGLRLPAGVSRVGGIQALAYVRARYTLTGGSDLGRIRRQQAFLSSLAHRVETSDVLSNPGKFTTLVRAVAASVQTDSDLTTEKTLALALAVKAVPSDHISFVSMPLADSDYRVPGVGSTVLWDTDLAARLFNALREDKPVDQVRAAPVASPTSTPSVPDPPSATPTSAPGDLPTALAPGKRRRHVQQRQTPPAPTSLSVHTAEQDVCR